MLHATTLLGEREKVTTTSWLVAGSINRKTKIMTIQESTDAAVADKEHIAGSISSQDVFDLTNNAQLGIKKPVADRSFSCIASRTSTSTFNFAAIISAVSIAFLSPLEMICVVPESRPVLAIASVRALPTSLRPQDGTGMTGSIFT